MDFADLTSTNEHAAALIQQQDVIEGTLIRADFQSGGKGYAGNSWQSEKGKNLLLSIILKPKFLPAKRQFFLNQVISLAVAATVEDFVIKENVKIKWPNDILFGEKKIAGILIENSVQGNFIQYSIVGVGLNVNQINFSGLQKKATSMACITGKKFSLNKVLDDLCEKLEYRYLQLKNNHVDQIQKDYMKQLFRVEEESDYSTAGKTFMGKIVGLTAEGKLILQVNNQHEVFGFKEIEMII
ncbi:MAG: biotin--[acetyl-CoA-carboxylase] ligase [Chitinophagales bacterium]|nr:biotin--[acetyl-CoA-carboxylase] ligase [Chitinophagales bacterium]